MVDGRVFYHDLDPEMKGYKDMWEFLKSEFSPMYDLEETQTEGYCENTATKTYELDSEIHEDLEAVKNTASGLRHPGQSTEYNT